MRERSGYAGSGAVADESLRRLDAGTGAGGPASGETARRLPSALAERDDEVSAGAGGGLAEVEPLACEVEAAEERRDLRQAGGMSQFRIRVRGSKFV